METTRSKVEDRAFELMEKAETRTVESVRRMAEKVDAWWPEATTSGLAERLPAYVERGMQLAEQELDREYRLAKRIIKNQRAFLKKVARAMAPHTAAHPRRAAVKAAA